jgi:pyruvate/2-oxoglutarate dehydrogenase complex dihydrolipoamide dehydrogenase (E3) component
MQARDYDLIAIGAGSAARDGAMRAARDHGARVALIEHERWGGSCPNVACTPTKAYLVAAGLAHAIDTLAPKIGIQAGPARVELAAVKAWKDSLKKPQEQWIADLRAAGFDTYPGTASFTDHRTIRVGGETLTADRILIATGSRTAVPPIDGLAEIDWVDHVSALELEELPRSLLVVGAGAVGLEFGQAFARFGSQVTVVDTLPELAPHSDPDAAAELRAALEAEGLRFVLDSRVERVTGGVATVSGRDGDGTHEITFDRILLASGRVPNVDDLELDSAGVETTRTGIAVDGRMRTSVEGIWAAGDVNGQAPFTPAAQYQARIAVDDMFDLDPSPADYSTLPTAIFTEPELGAVGLTEPEAREQGLAAEAVTHPFASVRRASYLDAHHGLYKIVFDGGSRRVLGLHVVTPGASDVVQGFAVAIRLGVTIDQLATAHHVFPSIGEGVKAAAERAPLIPRAAAEVEEAASGSAS